MHNTRVADRKALTAADIAELLACAPHRLLFFVGTITVLLTMAWWGAELTALRFGLPGWPQPSIPPIWAHAMLIQYGMFPMFIFGFLLTVFPRWLNQPPLPRARYASVAGCLFGGYVLANAGLLGVSWLLELGFVVILTGYLFGLYVLTSVLRASKDRNDHARSCVLAIGLGALGLFAFLVYLFDGPTACATLAVKLGTFGLLLPVFFSVTHRMLPFFSGNVVKNYRMVRPRWSLPCVWLLLPAHLLLDWRDATAWLWLPDMSLALVFAWHAYAWQPWKSMRPGLLAVLHLSFAWLPIAFVLYAVQDVVAAVTRHQVLGRAPLHALAIGYFASMLVAMVTRVTQGHSGRPLQMGAIAWLCFGLLQAVVLVRIGAEMASDAYLWLAVAAYGWLVAFLPWVLRSAWIYLTPRVDGGPG